MRMKDSEHAWFHKYDSMLVDLFARAHRGLERSCRSTEEEHRAANSGYKRPWANTIFRTW